VEHTGEVELEIEASTAEGVFGEALRALAAVIGNGRRGEVVSFEVAIGGGESAALLAAWLDELVYRAKTEELMPEEVERVELGEQGLSATVRGHRGHPRHLVKARPITAWRSSPPTAASARGWCSMSERPRPQVHGFQQVGEVEWELAAGAGPDMRVPARAFADQSSSGRSRPTARWSSSRTSRRYSGSPERRPASGVTITPSAGYKIDSCCSSQRTR
jgi:SHS2 domain-containing protein